MLWLRFRKLCFFTNYTLHMYCRLKYKITRRFENTKFDISKRRTIIYSSTYKTIEYRIHSNILISIPQTTIPVRCLLLVKRNNRFFQKYVFIERNINENVIVLLFFHAGFRQRKKNTLNIL